MKVNRFMVIGWIDEKNLFKLQYKALGGQLKKHKYT